MGHILLASKKDAEANAHNNKKLISDGDIDRIIYWGARRYFPNGVVEDRKPKDGEPDEERRRDPTVEEIFQAITESVYAQIKREVEALYLAEAEAAARKTVAPIVLTPTKA